MKIEEIFILLVILILLFPFLFFLRQVLILQKMREREKKYKKEYLEEEKRALNICVMCKSFLYPYQRMHSKILEYQNKVGTLKESIAYMYGCPHCDPREIMGSKKRNCPICKRKLKAEDHVIARFFERPNKKHIHIIGCSICKTNFKI